MNEKFLALVNHLALNAMSDEESFHKLSSIDESLASAGMDSLDYVCFLMYVADVFCLDERITDESLAASGSDGKITVRDLMDYVCARSSIPIPDPASVNTKTFI